MRLSYAAEEVGQEHMAVLFFFFFFFLQIAAVGSPLVNLTKKNIMFEITLENYWKV